MSSGLQWVFDLIDKVSRPAATMADKVGQAEKAMHGAAEAVASLEQKQEHAAHSAKHHESALDKLNEKLRELFFTKEAIKTIGELWEKVKEFASETLGEMKFKQDSILALEAMRGTRAEAIELFEGAEDFAFKTGQGVQDVMRVTKDLVASGFDPESVDSLRLMLADMRVVDPGKADSVAAIIGEIGRRGQMTSRQMIGLSNAGIDATLMWEALSRETGYSVEALRKMDGVAFKTGTAVKAIYSVGGQKFGKGVVGSLAEREAKTLPVLLTRVGMIPELIMSKLAGFDRGAGGGMLEGILQNLLAVFDPDGDSAQRIMASIRGLVDSIGKALGLSSAGGGGLFAELAGPNGPAKIEEIFMKITTAVEKAIPTIKQAAGGLWEIGEALAWVGRTVGAVKGFGDSAARKAFEMDEAVGRALPFLAGSDAERTRMRAYYAAQDAAAAQDTAAPISNASLSSHRSSTVNVAVHVHGNASKEDAEHIGRVSAEAVGQAHEQHAIQMGAQ